MLENTEENIEKASETADKKARETPTNPKETEKPKEIAVDETTEAVQEIEKSGPVFVQNPATNVHLPLSRYA